MVGKIVRVTSPSRRALTVPASAVVRTGERTLVFVDLGGGRLRPQDVETGRADADLVEVLAGLEPGQRVVCTVTGNGLKDPEWAISGAPAPVTIPVDAAAAAAQLGL